MKIDKNCCHEKYRDVEGAVPYDIMKNGTGDPSPTVLCRGWVSHPVYIHAETQYFLFIICLPLQLRSVGTGRFHPVLRSESSSVRMQRLLQLQFLQPGLLPLRLQMHRLELRS